MSASVVFIHLGPNVPNYLLLNLRRTASLFPSVDICLAGNSEETERLASMGEVRYLPLATELGDPRRVPPEVRRSGPDLSFWGGYWQKTLDRLVAFEEVHRLIGDNPIIHIEGDVILMPDFPFAEVVKSDKIRWVGYSDRADIASIVYSPSISESSWFSSKVKEVAAGSPSLTDMRILRQIRVDAPERIDLFTPLPNPEDPSAQWVFDGLHYGDWLFGQDPHAHWGIKKRRMKTTSFSGELEKYQFHVKGSRLEVMTDAGVGTIANLHVHSKELRFFDENIEGPLRALLSQVAKERYFYGFSAIACYQWAKSRLRRWSRSAFRPATWKRILSN